MERTKSESTTTTGSSPTNSQSRKVAYENGGNRRMETGVILTGVFLVCFLYVFHGGLSAQYDNSSADWQSGSSEVSQASNRGLGLRRHRLLAERNTSTSSKHKVLAANVYVATDIKTGMISLQEGARDNPLYHNFALFERDYAEMEVKFKIFVYAEAFQESGEYSNLFLPHPHPESKNIGNYYSEHKLKITLLKTKFVTQNASQAHLFFLPFSVNVMRNDMRVRSEPSIIRFVKSYIENVSQEFPYWNRSGGADHFFACCHSVGRDVPQALPELRHASIQLVCSSNYYYKNYFPHKDVALPQVWPRKPLTYLSPPEKRTRLAFYAGRIQNSNIRQLLIDTWGDDPDFDFYAGGSNGSYEQHFQVSKFCVHVRGYEVNTARISDAIHFGCVPIIISEYYELPLADILDWSQFSLIISFTRMPDLKKILQGVTKEQYAVLYENVLKVRKHFQWNDTPKKYDAFHLSMYQLWLKRFVIRASDVQI